MERVLVRPADIVDHRRRQLADGAMAVRPDRHERRIVDRHRLDDVAQRRQLEPRPQRQERERGVEVDVDGVVVRVVEALEQPEPVAGLRRRRRASGSSSVPQNVPAVDEVVQLVEECRLVPGRPLRVVEDRAAARPRWRPARRPSARGRGRRARTPGRRSMPHSSVYRLRQRRPLPNSTIGRSQASENVTVRVSPGSSSTVAETAPASASPASVVRRSSRLRSRPSVPNSAQASAPVCGSKRVRTRTSRPSAVSTAIGERAAELGGRRRERRG